MLLKTLSEYKGTAELMALIEQRNAFGMAKYGQPLMSEDGRNGLEDARQELGDLVQYVFKATISSTTTESELLDFKELLITAFDAMTRIIEKK